MNWLCHRCGHENTGGNECRRCMCPKPPTRAVTPPPGWYAVYESARDGMGAVAPLAGFEWAELLLSLAGEFEAVAEAAITEGCVSPAAAAANVALGLTKAAKGMAALHGRWVEGSRE